MLDYGVFKFLGSPKCIENLSAKKSPPLQSHNAFRDSTVLDSRNFQI